MLILLDAWVKHNHDDLSASRLVSLTDLVRVWHLSPGFVHTLLPSMEWFWGRTVENVERMQRNLNRLAALKSAADVPMKARIACWDGPAGWVQDRRNYCSKRSHELSWDLDAGQVSALKQDTSLTLVSPGAVYVNGFHVRLAVNMHAGKDKLRFGMVQDRLPKSIVAVVAGAKVYGDWDGLERCTVIGPKTMLCGREVSWTAGAFTMDLGARPRLQQPQEEEGIKLKLTVESVE